MAYNSYIVIPLATWAVAQVAKFAVAAIQGRVDLRYLYASGGMPSVHSAVVSALATTAFLIAGPGSAIFGITIILAAIVMYDSFGVRRASGEQAAALNMLIDSLAKDKIRISQPTLHLREVLGHSPLEVIIGAVLGVVLAGVFNYERLGGLTSFLQVVPHGKELWAWGIGFGLVVLLGLAQTLVLGLVYPKSATIKKLRKQILVASQTIGWLGLVTVALQYERASYMAWRMWSVFVLLAGLVWATTIISRNWRTVPEGLRQEEAIARKRKWFNFGKRKKK